MPLDPVDERLSLMTPFAHCMARTRTGKKAIDSCSILKLQGEP
jgi:hypothetical protein